MLVLKRGSNSFQYVSERNRARQYDFLRTAFEVSREVKFPIDRQFLCDLNFYAVQYLSEQPGKYRVKQNVEVGNHVPPKWENVEPMMGQFWTNLSDNWSRMSAVESAAYSLWGVNHIHPFVEGNGRSARALAYFILCTKFDYWLPGSLTITEQIRMTHRSEYCEILGRMDKNRNTEGITDLAEMVQFLERLLLTQLQSVP